MKTLKMTWVVLALISSFSVFAGSVGQNGGQVQCTESVQSGRYEGGEADVQRDKGQEASKSDEKATDR